MSDVIPRDYDALLKDIKARVRASQTRAGLAVNRELIMLYWQIGRDILARQQTEGWGSKVIDHLARDLKAAFPEMEGFSPRNLKYMRAFAEAWPDEQIVPQVVAQIPWGHNRCLLDKLTDPAVRLWYAQKTIDHGWSRPVLELQIESRLLERQGKAITNFARTLPPPQSDLVHQTLKDPYNFDFLTLGEDAHERHLERGLLTHIREFLLELGAGFAFVGSQYRLEIEGQEFFIDLLFYHLKLRCFVVIDLKMRAFEPEYAGKMNFYLAAVDDLLRHQGDAPTVGIILCKTKNDAVAEYALRNINSPIGVATHLITELTRSLPESLASDLPTVAELEAETRSVPFPELEDGTENETV
jgi:predicted nuclease of restriction endonuclease-like (RecB) superfamily